MAEVNQFGLLIKDPWKISVGALHQKPYFINFPWVRNKPTVPKRKFCRSDNGWTGWLTGHRTKEGTKFCETKPPGSGSTWWKWRFHSSLLSCSEREYQIACRGTVIRLYTFTPRLMLFIILGYPYLAVLFPMGQTVNCNFLHSNRYQNGFGGEIECFEVDVICVNHETSCLPGIA